LRLVKNCQNETIMDTLIIELTAALVHNYATPRNQSKVEISVVNNSGWLTVEDLPGSPRSTHRFLIYANDVGCPPLSAEQACYIFSIACSLISPGVLFSPLQPQRYTPNIRLGTDIKKIDNNIIITLTLPNPSITSLIIMKLEIDASKLMDIIKKLINFRLFELDGRTISELNTLDALKRYQEALLAGEPLACYKALFTSLEKAVNLQADKKDSTFDTAISLASGLPLDDIKKIREFNNRVKHTIRHKKDFEILRQGESNISHLSMQLKLATDNVLLSKI
jgi:hypothetical protein